MTTQDIRTRMVERLTPAMLGQRERILTWMDLKRPKGGSRPVLLSEMKREMGSLFRQEAFDGLVRDGVICAEFPEAKPGDSGRQFWNFAHWTVLSPSSLGDE